MAANIAPAKASVTAMTIAVAMRSSRRSPADRAARPHWAKAVPWTKQGCSCALERAVAGQFLAGCRHIGALALEIVGDGAAQAGIDDIVRRIGGDRQVAARQLVLALGAGFHPVELAVNREVDRLVIAQLEVQERVVLDRPPMAAVERV